LAFNKKLVEVKTIFFERKKILMKKILSIILVSAVLFGMVLSANAYTYNGEPKTAALSGDTYVYDFVDSDGNNFDVAKFTGHQGLGTYGYDPRNGVNRFSFYPNGGYVTPTNYKAGTYNEMYLYDDFTVGNSNDGKLKLEAGHIYDITINWTVWDESTILIVQNYGGATALNQYTVAVPAELINGTTDTTKNGTIINTTFRVDADKQYSVLNTSSTAATHVPAGRYLGLSGNKPQQYKIYSVTVTVYDKDLMNAVDSFENEDVNLTSGGVKDVFLPNGTTSKTKFEDGVDPANSGHGKTVKITNGETWASTLQWGVAAKTGLGNTEGFQVKKGVKYSLKFDIFCEAIDEGEGKGIGNGYYVATCPKGNVGITGNKKDVVGLSRVSGPSATDLVEGQWQSVEIQFTANNAEGADYLVFGINGFKTDDNGNGYAFIIHIDNISITAVTADGVAANAKRSIRAESGTGEDYVSAGLRFRAELFNETANASSEIGFIVAPTALANTYTGEGKWFEINAETGAPNYDKALIANVKNKVYGENGTNNQYQVIITELTKEGVKDKDLKGVNFTVIFYRKSKQTGEYMYYNVATSSYNEVNYAYLMSK
jgi:hypothetical protein